MIRWADIPRHPSRTVLRQFSALCMLVFGGAAAWRWWSDTGGVRTLLLTAGGVAGLIGLMRPSLMRPIFVGWLILTFPIGWAVSRTILLVLFYGVFTPIALLFRVIGRDALQLRTDPRRDSYWAPKGKPSGASYYRQY